MCFLHGEGEPACFKISLKINTVFNIPRQIQFNVHAVLNTGLLISKETIKILKVASNAECSAVIFLLELF